MKILALLLISMLSIHSFAGDMTKCLGQTEDLIHLKKFTGPVYQLNQYFVNEFTKGYGSLELKPEYFKKICESNDSSFSPSVVLLRYLMLEGKKIFDLDKLKNMEVNLEALSVDAVVQETPNLFFKYLSGLQYLAPTHDCLYNYLPHYKYFINRFHYLETEMSKEELLKDKDKLEQIFSSLTRFNSILTQCEKDKTERDKKKKEGKN